MTINGPPKGTKMKSGGKQWWRICYNDSLDREPSSCYSTDGPLSFSSTCDPTCNPQTSPLEGTARSHARSCQWMVHFSFHCLVMILLLGQNTRSRSDDLYLWRFPFSSYRYFPSWTEPEIYIANLYLQCFLFQQTITSNDTSPYSIIVIPNLPLMVTWAPS